MVLSLQVVYLLCYRLFWRVDDDFVETGTYLVFDFDEGYLNLFSFLVCFSSKTFAKLAVIDFIPKDVLDVVEVRYTNSLGLFWISTVILGLAVMILATILLFDFDLEGLWILDVTLVAGEVLFLVYVYLPFPLSIKLLIY